jgi:hypothetical protein
MHASFLDLIHLFSQERELEWPAAILQRRRRAVSPSGARSGAVPRTGLIIVASDRSEGGSSLC